MTITNRDLFTNDPTGSRIPNDGVTKVVRPETDEQWDVLRWELSSFVCDGQYARGLERILDSFLEHLTKQTQPAVWVSGFYGSGKSHIVRVLEHLWRDVELPGGKRARQLVTLPTRVSDQLTELSNAGKRAGGLWSAAGTMASGKSDAVRLAFLSVLFESAGLPEQYPLARFVIWAHQNGYLGAVREAVEVAGRSFDSEIHHLYVSPHIAKALLQADGTLGESVKDVRELLTAQFPPTTVDIERTEMLEVMDSVLQLQSTTKGKVPLTLIVLDEMQQYIGDDKEKAITVQLIAEDCSSRYSNQVLIVATGQSDLTATPTLQKLTDRFTLMAPLSDKDVETVVREVVLRKRPEHVPALRTALDDVIGEIDRHLGGTQLGPKAADKDDLVPDYPVLPTRRRFWELALRAIDRAGKAGVLRSQLRIVHSATAHVANQSLGHVVGSDFLYEEQAAGMLQTGVLLREIDELIATLRTEGPDGLLKARICSLVFLIGQMPTRTVAGDIGLRATAPFLADLLVEDLANDGARMRRRVPELLSELVAAGAIQEVTPGEYAMQTEEGAAWQKEYQSRLAAIGDDAIALLRSERLVAAVDTALGGLRVTQGQSKTPRRAQLYWGQDEPAASDGDVPVWIRDEWSVTESSVKKAAGAAGDDSPVIHVYLPRREAGQIKEALASRAAAEQTLQQRPTPQTDEGRAAQRAMKTRQASENERLDVLLADVVADGRVFQGGGNELTTTSNLRAAVETAVGRSLIRLFPRFTAGDHPNWGKVVTKARDGAPDALDAVGHHGDVLAHPVCKEVLDAISPGGTKGADLQKQFGAGEYGWPRDAVNGAIFVLLSGGHVLAKQDGTELKGPKELLPTQIGKVVLYKEDTPPTPKQRMAVRGLMVEAEVPYEAGQEGPQIPALLQKLKDLAAGAGGPPPLPEPPDIAHIAALAVLGGNQRFCAVADTFDRLRDETIAWKAVEKQRAVRMHHWRDLHRLLKHADGLSVASEVQPAVDAVDAGRQLLETPDPIAPLLQRLSDALRSEVKERARSLNVAQQAAVAELEAWPEWSDLDPADRQLILDETRLMPVDPPEVDSDAQLLEALDSLSLSGWQERIGFVAGRRDQARQRAARKLEPESVSVALPSATLREQKDLDAYIEALRAQVKPHLDANKTVNI